MSNFLARELSRSKYRLLGLVGQGQFGRVYCASHRKTGRLVALKELDRDRFSTHKFLRELRFLLSLQHPNIVTCQAMEQTATGRYLVMDYCEGGTLRQVLDEEMHLHPAQSLNLVTQILAGLAHAHQRGIVHCDIKPENILLTVHASGWTARISDFGIARLSQEMAAQTDFSNTGSPAYMAPERFYGQYSIASDLYAVGVLLFELLAGYRPFSGVPGELMSAHLNQTVKIPESLPAEAQTIILKALQKLPARRFRSAEEMLEQIQAFANRAEAWFSPTWSLTTLLRPTQFFPACDLQHEYQENLTAPIYRLMGEQRCFSHARDPSIEEIDFKQEFGLQSINLERCIFRAVGNQVGYQLYPVESCDRHTNDSPETVKPLPVASIRLPAPISNLVAHPLGCFAATQQAVYWLAAGLFNAETTQPGQTVLPQSLYPPVVSPLMPQLIAQLDREMIAAIPPNGNWIATATHETERSRSQISIWNLSHLQPFKPQTSFYTAPCFQLLALDARHIAAFSHLTDSTSKACITGVLIEIFTRRGTLFGSLKLPIPLRQVVVTPTPYRLLAMEPSYPNSLLRLDLKPLRIQRLGLAIAPKLLATTIWGCALMDDNGQIVLLDTYGQNLGQIQGPSQPTALSFLDAYRLLISTWNSEQGRLYVVNLQQHDLDILF
ncbi:MAG: serine/threonine protein kinase [Oscillatoriales cyanobacterium C42_A2020_001]|nr:serine/threonine protein kinase [Leptolyngbyaceae cyanobacterium C42_A2020_001]